MPGRRRNPAENSSICWEIRRRAHPPPSPVCGCRCGLSRRGSQDPVSSNNLLELNFAREEEEPGGKQQYLLGLRESGLKNPDLLEHLYDMIIDNYDYVGFDDRGDRGLHNAAERVVLLGCRPLCAAAECGLDKVAVGILGVPDSAVPDAAVMQIQNHFTEEFSDKPPVVKNLVNEKAIEKNNKEKKEIRLLEEVATLKQELQDTRQENEEKTEQIETLVKMEAPVDPEERGCCTAAV